MYIGLVDDDTDVVREVVLWKSDDALDDEWAAEDVHRYAEEAADAGAPSVR
jgi:hypothetical protein